MTSVKAPHVLVRSASTSELASVMQLLRLAHPTSSTTAHPPLPSSQIRQAPLGVTSLDITQSQSKPPPDSASRGSSGHELGVPARGQHLQSGSWEGGGGFPVKLGLLLTAVDGMVFLYPPYPPPLSPTHTTHMHTYSRSLTHTLCLSRSLFPTLTLCSSLSCPSLCQSLNVMVSFFVFLFVS